MPYDIFCASYRDFAYVARDKTTRVLKCHVFRCDTPAEAIATSLHEICSKVSGPAVPDRGSRYKQTVHSHGNALSIEFKSREWKEVHTSF